VQRLRAAQTEQATSQLAKIMRCIVEAQGALLYVERCRLHRIIPTAQSLRGLEMAFTMVHRASNALRGTAAAMGGVEGVV
jgi:hypothetical protein